jgi:hypothetical protein
VGVPEYAQGAVAGQRLRDCRHIRRYVSKSESVGVLTGTVKRMRSQAGPSGNRYCEYAQGESV